jgi:hypothetical protein
MFEMSPVELRQIDKRTANVYEAVIVAAKEARRLNEEQRIEFHSLSTSVPPKGLEDDTEDIDNPDQLRISLEFEKRPKPHIHALQRLLDGEVEYRFKEDPKEHK